MIAPTTSNGQITTSTGWTAPPCPAAEIIRAAWVQKSARRVAYEKMLASAAVVPAAADPFTCALCGDAFNILTNVRRDKWHPDCCTLCIRDRARGFGR